MAESSVQGKPRGWRGRESSIEAVGLERFLNSNTAKHGGKDYNYFVEFMNQGQNKVAISKAFRVVPATVDKWVKVYRNEQTKKVNQNAIH